MLWKDLGVFAVMNAGYGVYLDNKKGLGNIASRPNSDGKRRINLGSYFNFIKQPVTGSKEVKKIFWNPKNWDMNYLIVMGSLMGGYKLVEQTMS